MRDFGFPEAVIHFKQFSTASAEFRHKDRKAFIVLDDFHVINNQQILFFLEQYINLAIPDICNIIISRREPEINTVSLLAKGMRIVVTEDTLRLTQEEIADFLTQRGVLFAPGSLQKIHRETQGWILAVQLLSMALKRTPERPERAIATMKQNVFKLMEREAFADFPAETQRNMVKLALISSLPLTSLQEASDGPSFLKENLPTGPFIWFDSLVGDYRVHPLFAEFLQSKLHLLSEEEKQEMYRWAAQWYEQNGYHMDAMAYYVKLRDYPKMMGIYLSYTRTIPRDMVAYYLHTLEELVPLREASGFPIKSYEDSVLLTLTTVFIPWLLMELGRYDESRAKLLASIGEWEAMLPRVESGSLDASYLVTQLFSNYNNLAYLNMHTCVVTNEYRFHEHFKKSMYYFKMSPFPPQIEDSPFTCAVLRPFVCLVGESAGQSDIDKFLAAAREAVQYIPFIMNGLYYGYDDLVACELAFYRNQPKLARDCALQAILKGREKRQYSIVAVAAQFLLRVSLQEGDYPTAAEMLKLSSGMKGKSNARGRQSFIDLFSGFFYAQTGLEEMIAPWLIMDVKYEAADVCPDVRELLIHARCLLLSGRYYETLTALVLYENVEPEERFLFGSLLCSLFRAVAYMKTGQTKEAIAAFEQAYRFSLSGQFEMPFIELGRNMQQLAALAPKQADCAIDKVWLELIGHRASIYAKKADFVARLYKKEHQIGEATKLTERELQILNDIYQGLSRAEIAVYRYLSINTVKTIIKTLYTKLGADNNVDAVRIALEMKLI